ncbi:MAG: AAA family ATPase [Coleofasciculus sp. Co-bin14]|nr:AAA family ATPase [Coleofasciculus sp. Co-bin14]
MVASVINSSPTLWTNDIVFAHSLSKYFQMGASKEALAPGHHIIALSNELEIRQLARKIQEIPGAEVEIYQLENSLENFLAWSGSNAPSAILMGALNYSDWLESLENQPLSIKEAVALAEDILRLEPDSEQRNIALDVLRRRANVTEWSWDKKYLDLIRARLERTLQISNDPDEKLRLALLALAKETDPLKRERQLGELAVKHRIKIARLEKLAKDLHSQTKTPQADWMGLDELFDADIPGLEYLIPGMLPKGDTVLLVADAKVGKSLLAYDAAFAIATGESDFLGEKTQQGKVLIVQADEPQHSTKSRLLKRGFRREDTPNVQYINAFNITQMTKLEDKLKSFRPSLVIIDSLRRINVGREVSENSAEFADLIYQLKELLTRYGASGIIIHHANKNPDATGIQRSRGSSSIPGAVWGIWDFQRIPKTKTEGGKRKPYYDPKDLTRTLTVTSRDSEGTKLHLELDLENNHWISQGEEGVSQDEIQQRKSQRLQVLEALQNVAPIGLEAREINEVLDLGRGVYSILNRLLDQRLIGSRPSAVDKRRTVYYCNTPSSKGDIKESNCHKEDSPSPLVCVPDVIEYAETNGETTLESSITVRSQTDHRLITPKNENTDVINSDAEVEKVSEFDHTPVTNRGGEGVVTQLSHCHSAIQKIAKPVADAIANPPAPPAERTEARLPIYQRSDGGFELEPSATFTDEDVADLVNLLDLCESKEDFEEMEIRQNSFFTPALVEQACKFLSPEKYAQFKRWWACSS